MKDPVAGGAALVRGAIDEAYVKAVSAGVLPDAGPFPYAVEEPAEAGHGDFASNFALTGAKQLRMAPRAVAQAVLDNLPAGGAIARAEAAGPGFLNFFLDESFYPAAVFDELRNEQWTGRLDAGGGRKVMVEFVSANPTGPMHLGNARGGALGDSIASVLEAYGCEVSREFYVNDAGNQVELFGISLEARYRRICRLMRDEGPDAVALFLKALPEEDKKDADFPEHGYHGNDIKRRAKEFYDLHGDCSSLSVEELRGRLIEYALPRNIADMKRDLENYRVVFDTWFRESTLHADGSIERIIDRLRAAGHTYEKDGALWYRATSFGSEKDEVLIRSNGFYTYFAVDVAYHYNKFAERGFERVINVWGADHHGHVQRMKGAMDALGIGGDRLDVVLMQLVELLKDGKPVRMSKRTGEAVTLADLLEMIPVDSARLYFNLREYSSHFTFDLDLAVKESSDNPVFYIQYAHARICSILRGFGADEKEIIEGADETLLREPDEAALMRKLAAFPSAVARSAAGLEPSHITRYALDTAAVFHRFYTNCRVRTDERALSLSRAALCLATRAVIRRCLSLLRITAPETM